MSRFKRIKNTSTKKSSVSIDEKIDALNKELEKTGMSNVSEMMTTDNVYSTSTYVPPVEGEYGDVPNSSGIGGDGFTQSSAGSGTEGHAPSYSSVEDLYNNGVNHPIFQTPSDNNVPVSFGVVAYNLSGAGTNYGIIEEGNIVRGVLSGFIAGGTRPASYYVNIYNAYLSTNEHSPGYYSDEQIEDKRVDAELATQVENIRNNAFAAGLEFNIPWQGYRAPNMFADSTPYGTSYTHPTKGLLILAGFNLLGMPNRYTIQEPKPPTTKDPIRRGFEDEPIYPGPIESLFNLGKRAFDWLKEQAEKARQRAKKRKGKPNQPGSGQRNKPETNTSFDPLPDFEPITDPDDYTGLPDIPYEPPEGGQPISFDPFPDFKPITDPDDYTDVTGDDGTTFGPNKGQPKKEPKYKSNRKKNRPDVEGGISPKDIKNALDYLKYSIQFYGSVPTAAKNMLYHNNVQNSNHPDHRKHDPSSENYVGPKEVDFNPIERAQTDKMIEDIVNGLNGGKGPKDPNKLSLEEIKELSDGMNAKWKENQTWYNTFHSLPTHNGADGEPISKVTKNEFGGWDVESNYIFSDDQDASDPFSNAFANTPLWTPRKATVDSAKKNKNAEGGEVFKNKATGEVIGKQFNTQQVYRGRKPLSSKKNLFKSNSFTTESYITEGVGLGLYEPEAMNVDLADIRKGVMPEYPKKPPAEMIDGYHEKSPLRPKPLENEPYVKITKVDLIRNHRLKSKEADEMMDTINMINDHIKNHPEDLIHAQMRYPKDDPRLAELNWKMDQMLEAGEEYMDSNFKENQTLFKRATDRTKKNIKLTDPEYVQQKYDELRGTPKPKRSINKRNVSRFFKKPVNKKSSMEEIDDKIKQLDKDLLL